MTPVFLIGLVWLCSWNAGTKMFCSCGGVNALFLLQVSIFSAVYGLAKERKSGGVVTGLTCLTGLTGIVADYFAGDGISCLLVGRM